MIKIRLNGKRWNSVSLMIIQFNADGCISIKPILAILKYGANTLNYVTNIIKKTAKI